MDVKAALTRSYAGVPGWLVALGGGRAVYFLFLRKATSGTSILGTGATGVTAVKTPGAVGSTTYITNPTNQNTWQAFIDFIGDPSQPGAWSTPQSGESFNRWSERLLRGYMGQHGNQAPQIDWPWLQASYVNSGGDPTTVAGAAQSPAQPPTNPPLPHF